MASKDPNKKGWSKVWRSSMAKLRSSGIRTLSMSSLIRRLDPARFNGMDRWMVKGVKKRFGSAMSAKLYDMELWQLTACVALGYMLVSILFAVILWISLLWNPEGFSGDPPGGMSMFVGIFCMTLSALSQTAVSLTDLMPSSAYTITVVTIAHFVGILMGALLLGVLINKASIPSARVVFSDVCLLTSRNGEPMLILRIGNTRGNFLLNPEIRVGYLKLEATVEGENIMRMARIELAEPPAMAPCINIACPIGPDSPLWGKTHADLENEGAAIYVALAATDNQHFQEVYARRFYLVQDMRFNCRFMDIMRTDPSGARLVDFRRFNTVIQNTIMPVSYGLTFDETVIVNGPDVHQPQPPRRPSRSSSQSSLPRVADAATATDKFEHLKMSAHARSDVAAAQRPAGGGVRRLWRRPPGSEDATPGGGGAGDALTRGGLEVHESTGGGPVDGDAFANSGASSNGDSGSPPPMQIKVGSLLPEPDGDMGGVTFNRRQVNNGPASKQMTRLGVFKRVDSDGKSVGEHEDSDHGAEATQEDNARPADLQARDSITSIAAALRRSLLNAATCAGAESPREEAGTEDGSVVDSPQGSCDSADFGPELDPVARRAAHSRKRTMKFDVGPADVGQDEQVRDRLAPRPETTALMRTVPGELLDPDAQANGRPRPPPGVGAILSDTGENEDAAEGSGAASDPETSDAPELHMHEGSAAAAPVPRLRAAGVAGTIPAQARQRVAGGAAEPAAAAPSAAAGGAGATGARTGAQQRSGAATSTAAAPRAAVRVADGAAGTSPPAPVMTRQPAGQAPDDLPVLSTARRLGAAGPSAATRAPDHPAAQLPAASASRAPPQDTLTARTARPAAPAGGSALPEQWRAGRRGGESVKMSGALRAVMGAKRWRARAIATVPEAAVLEGEANGSAEAGVDSGASDGTASEAGTTPRATHVRSCASLRATLLGGDTRPLSSALLSASSVFSRTSSEAGDTWSSFKAKDL